MTAIGITLIIFFSFLSTFIQRVTGFGFGIVFMSVAPYLMPSYGEATALSGMLALVCALGTGLQLVKFIPWKKLTIITATFLVISFFAVRLVAHVDSKLLKHILGVVLILASIYFSFINGKLRIRPGAGSQICMGTLSGMMGGLFGMQGPPAVIYFISCTDSKEEYMAMAQWYFIIGNVAMTIFRAGNGFLTGVVLKSFLIGIIPLAAGLFLGHILYRHLKIDTVRKFVYIFIGVAGIVALCS